MHSKLHDIIEMQFAMRCAAPSGCAGERVAGERVAGERVAGERVAGERVAVHIRFTQQVREALPQRGTRTNLQ
jgi:hypothetical protein